MNDLVRLSSILSQYSVSSRQILVTKELFLVGSSEIRPVYRLWSHDNLFLSRDTFQGESVHGIMDRYDIRLKRLVKIGYTI